MSSRRDFLIKVGRGGLLAGLSLLTGGLIMRARYGKSCNLGIDCSQCSKAGNCEFAEKRPVKQLVWQLDPAKCVQCGKCADNCVLNPSAVKCMHVFAMCGYCDLCGRYLKAGTTVITTGAENQLCPTSAIKRSYVEDPYFEYHVDEALCIGCGKCVKGCASFGNGSMQLQINHSICVHCNECAIARVCPADAFTRVPIDQPYLLKGFDKKSISDQLKTGA